MVEVTVKINAGDLYDYMLMHTYNSAAGLLGSVFGALLVVYAIASKNWLFLVLGAIMLLYLPWTLFIKSRRQILSNAAFAEPLHYTLNEEGLVVSQGDASEQMAWQDMYKAVSTNRSIILYTSPVNATIFPKRDMGERTSMVIEMISTHMEPKKVKIRQ